MKLFKKLLAIAFAMLMLVMPLAADSMAEMEGWQSALLDAFGMILDAYDEEDDAAVADGNFKLRIHGGPACSQQTIRQA